MASKRSFATYYLNPQVQYERIRSEWVALGFDRESVYRITGDTAEVIGLLHDGDLELPDRLLPAAEILADRGIIWRSGDPKFRISRRRALQLGVGGAVGLSVLALPSPAMAGSYWWATTTGTVSQGSVGIYSTWVFTTSGTWKSTISGRSIQFLLVGGGGGGGTAGATSTGAGGGGGAGGDFISGTVSATANTNLVITRGTGGAGGVGTTRAAAGGTTLTTGLSIANGYGGVGGMGRSAATVPTNRGSGSGGGYNSTTIRNPSTAGTGGSNGGVAAASAAPVSRGGGGGGGYSSAGSAASSPGAGVINGGPGGAGYDPSTDFGYGTLLAGGGGGSGRGTGAAGGTGTYGGGSGVVTTGNGAAGAGNTGGGGGGTGTNGGSGGAGGSGIAIVRQV